jgi:methionine-R-sulfoxide reductase
MGEEFKKDLKERLTPLQYHVTQEAGTERPYTGKYNKFYEQGTYVCVVCKQELFSSDTKYDSGCGWPAFYDVLEKGRVTLHNDPSLGNYRKITNLCVFYGSPQLATIDNPHSHHQKMASHIPKYINKSSTHFRNQLCFLIRGCSQITSR